MFKKKSQSLQITRRGLATRFLSGVTAFSVGGAAYATERTPVTEQTLREATSLGRTKEAFELVRSYLNDGEIFCIDGISYQIDPAAEGKNSAAHDLGVDGIIPHGDFIRPEHCGAPADGENDDALAITRALSFKKPLLFGPKTYVLKSEVVFPMGDGEKAWSSDYAPVIRGSGMNLTTILVQFKDGYGFKSHEMDGDTETQYQGGYFGDMTIRGNGDPSGNCCAIGIANTRMFTAERLKILGFPGGAGIKCYAKNTGGMYNPIISGCYLGERVKESIDGFGLNEIYKNCLRYAVWLNGNNGEGSGVNDALLQGNQIKNILVAGLFISGHGESYGEKDDCSANIRSIANHYYAKPARTIEELDVESATSDSVKVTGSVINTESGAYKNMRVYVLSGNGKGQTRQIENDTYSSDTKSRELTLKTPWDQGRTPKGLSGKEAPDNKNETSRIAIRWGDDAANDVVGLENYPVAIFADNVKNIFEFGSQIEDCFPLVTTEHTHEDDIIWCPMTVANSDGVRLRSSDGMIEPAVVFGAKSRGNSNYSTNNIITGYTLQRAYGSSIDGFHGPVGKCFNISNETLRPGDVVNTLPSGSMEVTKSKNRNEVLPLVIAGDRNAEYPPGSIALYANSGAFAPVSVKKDEKVAPNDTLISGPDGCAIVDNEMTDPKRIIGYATSGHTPKGKKHDDKVTVNVKVL